MAECDGTWVIRREWTVPREFPFRQPLGLSPLGRPNLVDEPCAPVHPDLSQLPTLVIWPPPDRFMLTEQELMRIMETYADLPANEKTVDLLFNTMRNNGFGVMEINLVAGGYRIELTNGWVYWVTAT